MKKVIQIYGIRFAVVFLAGLLSVSTGFSRTVTDHLNLHTVLSDDGSLVKLTPDQNGSYLFSFSNGLSGKKMVVRNIVFKNKKDAQGFIQKISTAMSSNDGICSRYLYGDYDIRMCTQMGNVFMIIREAGQASAQLRVSKDDLRQINIL